MKATGIVRRIDELGRIVIPKEIRRVLHIRESDPIEIFTDREGHVILKKYSPLGELTEFAGKYAETLASVSGHMTLIADRDTFIAAAGGAKAYQGKAISKKMEEKLNNRETVLASKGDRNFIPISEEVSDEIKHQAIVPILSEGDMIGAVVLLSKENKAKMADVELKLIQAASSFLGRQIEH